LPAKGERRLWWKRAGARDPAKLNQ
jgi:hypothetical protein